MPKGYTSSKTSVHFMNYHFVWCPKYRRKVIVADIETRLQDIIRDTAKENGWEIIALETMPDHVHLFIKAVPEAFVNGIEGIGLYPRSLSINEMIKMITSRSGR